MSEPGVRTATAWAPVNIALIKHWGYHQGPPGSPEDLPARPSLSLTLEHGSRTTVTWREQGAHTLHLNGALLSPDDGEKAAASYDFLEQLRAEADLGGLHARVEANSEVPLSAGFASSAAGGAALTLAALQAAGRGDADLDEQLAWCRRLGSVSALRSLRGGVVRLNVDHAAGRVDLESLDTELDLAVLGCLVQSTRKKVSSSAGHATVTSSPYWPQFESDAGPRLADIVEALSTGDLDRVGTVAEADALAMHAVMLTCHPPIVYATDATWRVWHQVVAWRQVGGPQGYCTLDAGPNPHVVCPAADADELQGRLERLTDVQQVYRSRVARRAVRLV